MGMELLASGEGTCTVALPWDDRFYGDPAAGLVHGGVLSTLLDATCGIAAFLALRSPSPVATLDLRVDHLRPAEPGRRLVATGEVVRATRQVLFVRGIAHHDEPDAPVAVATATFAVTP
jgi:uncharacterized protein (TIGR00369 family)